MLGYYTSLYYQLDLLLNYCIVCTPEGQNCMAVIVAEDPSIVVP